MTRESVSSCGTRKLLVRLEDGLEVETVVIPDLTGSRCGWIVEPSGSVMIGRAMSSLAASNM